MKLSKSIRYITVIVAFGLATAVLSGCGGVSDAQMAELNNLRSEVNSLQAQSDALKQQRADLEKMIAEKNAKLEECKKMKAETKANLEKIVR